jgi:hypothetical protein
MKRFVLIVLLPIVSFALPRNSNKNARKFRTRGEPKPIDVNPDPEGGNDLSLLVSFGAKFQCGPQAPGEGRCGAEANGSSDLPCCNNNGSCGGVTFCEPSNCNPDFGICNTV